MNTHVECHVIQMFTGAESIVKSERTNENKSMGKVPSSPSQCQKEGMVVDGDGCW